jgi:L-ascorbate metabolism protein UlaG (beta-lactamase superfamily)
VEDFALDPASLFAPYSRGGRFFCPWAPGTRSRLSALRFMLQRAPAARRRPRHVPVVANDGASLGRVAERPALTWIGHASFALHEGERVLLLDPHFGRRALLPARFTPPGIPLAAVPADAIALLTHNHYDHLDAWTLARLPKTIEWRVPRGLGAKVRSFGFERVRELGWWEEDDLGGWRVTLLPAQHWSNRMSQPVNSTLWGGWLIDTGRTRIYHAGDSGHFHGFAEFGRRLAPLDAAVLPIGAYLPRWFMRDAHMDPEEALAAFRATRARRMVPMHWGAFDLADEAVDEPPRVLAELLARPEHADLAPRVLVPAVGETLRW